MFYIKKCFLHAVSFLRVLFFNILDGSSCLICKQRIFSQVPICPYCIKKIFYKPLAHKLALPYLYCSQCSTLLISEHALCFSCRETSIKEKHPIDRMFFLYPYIKEYVDIVLYWKNENIRSLSPFFATLIAKFIKHTPILREYTIVPVPPRPKKLKERGWDQMEDISTFLKFYHHLPISRILARRDGHSQKGLSKMERELNLIEKFYVKKRVRVPKKVIILDDVITTGTTIKICTSLLKKRGAIDVIPLLLFSN